jgi:hypothetical protein
MSAAPHRFVVGRNQRSYEQIFKRFVLIVWEGRVKTRPSFFTASALSARS